jgi:hypothetical protein
MKATVRLDGAGTASKWDLDPPGGGASPAQVAEMQTFHAPIGLNLVGSMLPLPNKTVKANETWTAARYLHVDSPNIVGEKGALPKVGLNLTCTYLGVRPTTARREEAVVLVVGAANILRGSGKAVGEMFVDVATGTITHVHLKADFEVPGVGVTVEGKLMKIKLRALVNVILERGRI